MELDTVNTTMLEATQESVESLAFAEVFKSKKPLDINDKTLQVQMDISSPETGTFILQAPHEMIELIAQSLFPAGEELTESKTNDLASELLNTIGGNFLTKILPDSTSFSLGLPQISSPALPKEQEDLLKWSFTLEEIPFSLYLTGEIVHIL